MPVGSVFEFPCYSLPKKAYMYMYRYVTYFDRGHALKRARTIPAVYLHKYLSKRARQSLHTRGGTVDVLWYFPQRLVSHYIYFGPELMQAETSTFPRR